MHLYESIRNIIVRLSETSTLEKEDATSLCWRGEVGKWKQVSCQSKQLSWLSDDSSFTLKARKDRKKKELREKSSNLREKMEYGNWGVGACMGRDRCLYRSSPVSGRPGTRSSLQRMLPGGQRTVNPSFSTTSQRQTSRTPSVTPQSWRERRNYWGVVRMDDLMTQNGGHDGHTERAIITTFKDVTCTCRGSGWTRLANCPGNICHGVPLLQRFETNLIITTLFEFKTVHFADTSDRDCREK